MTSVLVSLFLIAGQHINVALMYATMSNVPEIGSDLHDIYPGKQ